MSTKQEVQDRANFHARMNGAIQSALSDLHDEFDVQTRDLTTSDLAELTILREQIKEYLITVYLRNHSI